MVTADGESALLTRTDGGRPAARTALLADPLQRHQHDILTVHCFFFNDTATTEIYTLSLHDALPICLYLASPTDRNSTADQDRLSSIQRSEEHTSELQSRQYLVCRLLLEKKQHN